MYAIYGVPFTINIPPMLAYIPYMDPMGIDYPTKTQIFPESTSPFPVDFPLKKPPR